MRRVLLFFVLILFTVECSIAQKKNRSKSYSEEKALECIDDYYSFYHADYIYYKAETRRVSSNVFYVSLQERFKEKDDHVIGGKFFFSDTDHSFFWHSKVLILTINSSTKYRVTEKLY